MGPDMRRTEAATCNAGCDGISGRARDVIVAIPRVVGRSPAMTVIRARPSTTPFASTTFLAPWRRSSDAHGGSMRTTSRDERSEEHTSELQSPCNLVCRLLLEKKKKNQKASTRRRQQLNELLHIV